MSNCFHKWVHTRRLSDEEYKCLKCGEQRGGCKRENVSMTMTTEELRDKFAMFAMQAIISSGSDAPLAALAELAYAQADAMIAEKIRQSRETKEAK